MSIRGLIDSATGLRVDPEVRYQPLATTAYSTTFTSADARLVEGVLTITHSLGQKVVNVTIADGTDKAIIPDEVTYTGVNTCAISLVSHGAISGTWSVTVIKAGGSGSGLVGEWTLVERKTFAAPATSYTFSGLNGDVDRRYRLITVLINTAGASTNLLASCNTDTTANNYPQQDLYGANTLASALRGTNAGFFLNNVINSNLPGWGETLIFAKSGMQRGGKTITWHVIAGGSTVEQAEYQHAFWSNTADNITQFVCTATQTGGIGIGSYIELWKLAQ